MGGRGERARERGREKTGRAGVRSVEEADAREQWDNRNGKGRRKSREDHTKVIKGHHPTPTLLLTRFPDHDPPRTHAKVHYLLNAWHSTTSASAEGVAFMEEDSHKRAAVGDGWH